MICEAFTTREDYLNRAALRARKALAHTMQRRADASTAKAVQRQARAERHRRRDYLEALYLSEISD